MPSIAILREVQQLHNVSDRLGSLAEQHPLVSEALATISGSVRNTAFVGGAGCDKNSPLRRTKPSKCLICGLAVCGVYVAAQTSRAARR